jgi:ABC-2 type transport system ATP-binding protein
MLQVGRVPQTLQVAEHLRLFASYYRQPLPTSDVIAMTGLSGLERRPFAALSSGQQQRVLFALAVCGNPDLLVLDEPTSSLDVDSRRTMWSVIRGYADRGAAILLTTHDLAEAEALAEHVVVLDRGRIVQEGSPAALAGTVASACITCVSTLATADVLALPGVVGAERVGRTLRVLTSAAGATTAALLGRDPALSDLQVSRASLEDAFVAITR